MVFCGAGRGSLFFHGVEPRGARRPSLVVSKGSENFIDSQLIKFCKLVALKLT